MKIYHYTSIDTLALILESRKIRFTRLDYLDDLQEYSLFKSFPIHYSTYVSCWTEDDRENIALWKMYTSDMHGVRIGMKHDKIKLPDYKNPETIKYDDFTIIPIDGIRPYFQKVQYLDDEELIEMISQNVQKIGSTTEIGKNGEGVGYHKSKYWEFQNESRFIILAISETEGFKTGAMKMLNGQDNGREFLDIPFLTDAFNDLEITLGPKCTYAEELKVKALLKAYNVECEPKKSALIDRVRK